MSRSRGMSERTCYACGRIFPSDGRIKCETCRIRRVAVDDNEIRGKPLTAREKQVCGLVAQAKANKEIAWDLRLTEGTIKQYLDTIYRKTGVHKRTALALWWLGSPVVVGQL